MKNQSALFGTVLGTALLLAGCPADGDGGGASEGGTEGGSTTADTEDPSVAQTGEDSTGASPLTTGEDDGSSGDPSDTAADSTGETAGETSGEVCGDIPTRMVFFGDSLYACFGQEGGKDGMGCSARLAHEYLAEAYAPGVTYENAAQSGNVTSDVPSAQMPGVEVGQPGHALVVIWVGGNDISGLLLSSDEDAESTYRDELAPELDILWDRMLGWVDDPANFPDGATLIVSTQFNPFDDCSADPFNFMSPLKTSLLGEYNDRIRERIADRENSYLADQYEPFLGHAHHYGTEGCPNYTPDSAYWMIGGSDLVHPNTLGHITIAGTLRGTLDEIYSCD